jgi:TetR/AcrR family transcriptional regulator, transcriptional repressor for nem operon
VGRTRGFEADDALDAALVTFWRSGFEATTMQALCRAMAVQPGSLYAAFGGKRDLFVAALRRYAQTVSVDAIHRITSAPTGLQGLRDYFAHLVEAMVDGNRRWGCLLTNSLVEFAARDPELVAIVTGHLANLQAAFAAALTRCAAAGELRPGVDPDQAAALLVAVVQGMNVLAKGQPGREPLRAVADAALAGLLPDPSPDRRSA